ncbi:MAG: ABC transporter ATP-binding protein [Candidatus Micrarchaeota archaeon]
MKEKETANVLEFREVVKEYKLGKKMLRVLNGITFAVKKGEFIVIMGPSGSGKSTMLQLMGCLDKPSFGKVVIDGDNTSALSSNRLADIRRKKIGFVFQAFNLLPNFSALQNVELAMSIDEKPKSVRLARARKLLGLVGLAQRENHKPAELSGGEKQRVAIARALANKPSFLLADEPTGNLDSKSGGEIMSLIRSLWKEEGTSIVMVTHEPHVAQYSQRILHILDGRIESEERPNHKFKKSNLKSK